MTVVEPVPARPPLSKIGDLWFLGRHRILCGSALDAADFAALMGEERAAMVFIDPPYNLLIDGHASGLGAVHHRPFPMASGEMSRAEFTAFLAQACRNLAAFSVDASLHYASRGRSVDADGSWGLVLSECRRPQRSACARPILRLRD